MKIVLKTITMAGGDAISGTREFDSLEHMKRFLHNLNIDPRGATKVLQLGTIRVFVLPVTAAEETWMMERNIDDGRQPAVRES